MFRYPVGTRLRYKGVHILGVVVECKKLSGDICVRWENGMMSSYDEWFLDANCEIVVMTSGCRQWGVD